MKIFSKRERPKSKYKFGGTQVCKAEEVRKHFVNPKIECLWLVCKLHYLQFGFQIYRGSRSQMFFGIGALKDFVLKIKAFKPAILLKRDSNISAFL